MPKIFVSYRREDNADAAQAIYDKLADHFGAESVVFDVNTIAPGVDFVQFLNRQVNECDALLAVIGDHWLDLRTTDGTRRIDDREDFVRIEIAAALRRKIPVIPVLVGKASMPSSAQLPRGLKRLSRSNAAEVRAGRDWQTHLERLVRDVGHSIATGEAKTDSDTRDQTARRARGGSESSWTPRRWGCQVSVSVAILVLGLVIYGGIIFLTKPANIPGFVLIEPGKFIMGSPQYEPGREDDETQHQVTLTEGFYLGQYEVTQAQYEG